MKREKAENEDSKPSLPADSTTSTKVEEKTTEPSK